MVAIPLHNSLSISWNLCEKDFLTSDLGRQSKGSMDDQHSIRLYETPRLNLWGVKLSCYLLFKDEKIFCCQFIPYIKGASWINECTDQVMVNLQTLKKKMEAQLSIAIPYQSEWEKIFIHHERRDGILSLTVQY